MFFALSLATCLLAAETDSITRYLELSPSLGPKGDWTRGEMELVWDPLSMSEMQRLFAQPVGIVAEDRYWLWVRDAVILPSGERTTYNRFFPKKGLDGPAGIAVLAVTAEKKILANLIYRHATRSWEIELPRGGRNRGETAEAAAKREVREETGYLAHPLALLGEIATDSGILANCLQIFFAQVDEQGAIEREEEEAIASVLTLTKEEAIAAFCRGQMECDLHGQTITAFCRDSCFAYALLIAEKKGML